MICSYPIDVSPFSLNRTEISVTWEDSCKLNVEQLFLILISLIAKLYKHI